MTYRMLKHPLIQNQIVETTKFDAPSGTGMQPSSTDPQAAVATTASEISSPKQPAKGPVTGPWFITSCLLLPVIWGVLVHLVFNRLRRRQRPGKLRETGWPDYQI